MDKIKVLLADDHEIVRAGLKRIIEEDGDISVVKECSNGLEVVREYNNSNPDIVVTDIFMPVLDGIDVTKQLVDRYLGTRILVLTICSEEQYALRILRAGALGFITKGASPSELRKAIRTVSRGLRYLSDEGKDTVFNKLLNGKPGMSDTDILSDREMQVLCSLAKGKKMREIAESLLLSMRTIETYRTRLMSKLGLKNRAEIVEFALSHELIS
jgi:DNA-binding NarL/FixJ family response regulator